MRNTTASYSKDNPYSSELTNDWAGFCKLWLFMMAHLNTYGQPPALPTNRGLPQCGRVRVG